MTIEASAAEGTETAASEAAFSSGDDEKTMETARNLGWVPEHEFKGDKKPERFKTASEFIADTPPSVLKLLERIEKAGAAKIEERIASLEKVNKHTIKIIEQNHEKQLADLRASRREAVQAGDEDAVERISTQIEKVKDSAADGEEVEDLNAAFAKRNPWYGDDDDLTAEAIRISKNLVEAYAVKNKGKQIPLDEMFDKVEQKIKQSADYKAKYGNGKSSAANGHAAVDGGGEGAAPNGRDPFSKLTSSERAKADSDMKKYPKVFPSKQSWMNAYEGKV